MDNGSTLIGPGLPGADWHPGLPSPVCILNHFSTTTTTSPSLKNPASLLHATASSSPSPYPHRIDDGMASQCPKNIIVICLKKITKTNPHQAPTEVTFAPKDVYVSVWPTRFNARSAPSPMDGSTPN